VDGDGQVLVEREAELELLAALVHGVPGGAAALATIEGPAGIGKTRLVAAARLSAVDNGLRALGARGSELESGFPFGVVRQLLEGPLRRVNVDDRGELLAGAAGGAARVFDDGSEPPEAHGSDPSFEVLNGLYWLVSNLAARMPLLLTVDDAHWADVPSLRFLLFLARRLEELPLFLLVTFRAEAHGGGEFLTDLAAQPSARRVRLSPLSVDAVAAVVRRELGSGADDEFSRACHTATAGNPFLLHELLRELACEGVDPTAAQAGMVRSLGPKAVSRTVLLRLRRLPDEAAALAQAVAVLGDGAALAEAAALARLAEPTAADAASALRTAEILEARDRLRFVHPIVRAAVYDDLSAADRARRHGQAAQVLALEGAPAEQVATHLLVAPPNGDPRTVATLEEAARSAAARGVAEGGVAYLRRAMLEPPPDDRRQELLSGLGFAELQLGDAAAIGHLEAALDATADPRRRVDIAKALTMMLTITGRADETLPLIEAVTAGIRTSDPVMAGVVDAELTAQAFVLTAHADVEPAVRERADARLRQFAVRGGTSGAERLAQACLAFSHARAATSAADAAAHAERGIAVGRLLDGGPAGPGAGLFYMLINALVTADRLDFAERALRHAVDDAMSQRSVPGWTIPTAWLSYVAFHRGRLTDAEEQSRLVLARLEDLAWSAPVPMSLAYLLDTLRQRGLLAEAEAALRAHAGGEEIARGVFDDYLLAARGRLRIALGRPSEGADDLLEYGRRVETWAMMSPRSVRYRSDAAAGLAAAGDDAEARRLLDEDLDHARRWGTPRGIGTVLTALARLERGDRGLELVREAVAELERSPARHELACALVDLGARLRRSGRRADSREPLRRGLELAHVCAAKPLEEEALAELAAAGVRPQRFRLSGVEALTPSERRVAELAGEGLSNGEIAQRLFVTQKTVEVHLTHAYRKLDIRSRTQLGRALAGDSSAAPGAVSSS
jgi:DNA-binding CsgD family transcriptional regulator